MRYSVYNYDRRNYDYYDGPGPSGTHASAPPKPIAMGDAVSPEVGTWRLPMGCKKVGSGDLPVGRIASTGAVSSLGDITHQTAMPIIAFAAAYFAWRYLR